MIQYFDTLNEIQIGVIDLSIISIAVFSLADILKWWHVTLLVIGALAVVPGIALFVIGIVVYCQSKSELHAWLSVSTVQYNS